MMRIKNFLQSNRIRGVIQQKVNDLSKYYSQMTLRCHVLKLIYKFPHLQQNLIQNVRVDFHPVNKIVASDKNMRTDDRLYLRLVFNNVDSVLTHVPVISITNAVLVQVEYQPQQDTQHLQTFLQQLYATQERSGIPHLHLVELTEKHVLLVAYGQYGGTDAEYYKLLVACLQLSYKVQKIGFVDKVVKLACGDLRGTCLCSKHIQFAVSGSCYDNLNRINISQVYDNRVYASLKYYQNLKSMQIKHKIETRLKRKHHKFRVARNSDLDRFNINVEFINNGQVATFRE